ncbi:MAG: NYN domain-containing protein [Anaerolineae bacterium]
MPLLIDGHNLIGQLPDLSLSDPDDEQQLVERLWALQTRQRTEITVVFDPGTGAPLLPGGGERRGRLHILYAPPGQRADDLLLSLIRRARDRRGCILVTSDRALQAQARQLGASIVPASEFARRLSAKAAPAQPSAKEQPPSADEVETWLRLFSQGRKAKR